MPGNSADIWARKQATEWNADEAERVKEAFCARRPNVPRQLAVSLWEYWQICRDGRPPFDDDEDNMALLLHVGAHGESVPTPDDPGDCETLLTKFRADTEEPLVPERLPWGPRAALAPEVQTALHSPVLHAWTFLRGGVIQKIVILGAGLPELEAVVWAEAFRTCVRIQTGSEPTDDILNIGAIKITAPGAAEPLDLPFRFIGTSQTVIGQVAETAQGELRRLQGFLREIERGTRLVQTHEVELDTQQELSREITQLVRQTTGDQVALWAPGEAASEFTDLIAHPPHPGRPVFLVFAHDLLDAATYRELLRQYCYAHCHHLLVEFFTRWDLYARHELHHLSEKKEWDADKHEARMLGRDPVEYCVEKRSPKVHLTEKFDFETGQVVSLSEPDEMSSAIWYEQNLPSLAEQYCNWRLRMEAHAGDYMRAFGLGPSSGNPGIPPEVTDEELRERLAAGAPIVGPPVSLVDTEPEGSRALEPHRLSEARYEATEQRTEMVRQWLQDCLDAARPENADWSLNTPFARVTTSRFFDCVMRQQAPSDLGPAEAAFQTWRESIQPLLWFEWRCQLRKTLKAEPPDVFSRQTTFYAQPDEMEGPCLAMVPHVVVDRRRSVLVVDPKRQVVTVHDATEHARRTGRAVQESPLDLPLGHLAAGRQASDGHNVADDTKEALLSALQRSPREASSLLLDILAGRHGETGAAEESAQLAEHLKQAEQITRPAWALNTAFRALAVGALHTARSCLRPAEGHPQAAARSDLAARAYLFAAVLECLAAGVSVDDIAERLPRWSRGDYAGMPPPTEVQESLENARRADSEDTERRLNVLQEHGTITLLRQLLQDLPRVSAGGDAPQQAALLAQQAAESACLAQQLSEAAGKLSPQGEAVADVLLKIGRTVGAGLLPAFAGTPRDSLYDLGAVLTGNEPPRLGASDR